MLSIFQPANLDQFAEDDLVVLHTRDNHASVHKPLQNITASSILFVLTNPFSIREFYLWKDHKLIY
ncbi:unnamed protein product [Camellia sinensis]